jgi:hypothetical protein
VQVPRCSWQSKALDEAPYKLSRAVAKLASITFWSLAFSYWINKPWFLTEGKLLLYSSYLPPGVPNWTVIYINTAATSSGGKCRLGVEGQMFLKFETWPM